MKKDKDGSVKGAFLLFDGRNSTFNGGKTPLNMIYLSSKLIINDS